LVVRATVAAFVCGGGGVVWLAANHSQWLPLFFAVPGRLIVIALNLAGLGLSVVARRQFSRSEPLGVVWSLVVLAAACHLAGGVLWQVEGEGWQRLRMVLAGPVQTVLLAAGLAVALRIYRRSGLQGRPRFADWLPMGVAAGFAMWAIYDFLLRVPATPVSFEGAVILVDIPLLSLLLIEAILVRRFSLRMGGGLIAQCWGAFTAAILVSFVGDVAVWLFAHSPVPVPLSATSWYVWFLASAFYALAPAYQVEACRRASV
jgi:hypothetical protein